MGTSEKEKNRSWIVIIGIPFCMGKVFGEIRFGQLKDELAVLLASNSQPRLRNKKEPHMRRITHLYAR
jgi:hypothetical protein